jgi:hypothetical protein
MNEKCKGCGKIAENMNELSLKLLDLCEIYNDHLNPTQIGFAMISLAVHMLYECSPDGKGAMEIISIALQEGQERSLREKTSEKTGEAIQ